MTGYKELPRVVAVMDGNTAIINRGSDAEVREDDRYLIFRLGDNVVDPDTGEDLGALEIVVGEAKVQHVQEKMTTLISARMEPGKTRRITRSSRGFVGAALRGPEIEEVDESGLRKAIPLNAEIGDLAKPL